MTDAMYPTDVDFGTLDEIRDTALHLLHDDVADFLEGGAGAEVTMAANRSGFRRRRILPEPMSGVGPATTATTVLGMDLATPIMVAPFGGDALFHTDGHLAVSRAAQSAGIIDIVPEAGSFPYEAVRDAAPGAARIAQLHPFEQAPAVVDRIVAAGFDALCVTVDCPIGGYRTRNLRNRFSPDLAPFSGNVATETSDGPRVAEVMGQLMSGGGRAWTWQDLEALTSSLPIPWIAKGILTPTAAQQAVDAGASAIVVSNHGGRQVDPGPASIDMLPAVRDAVGPALPIILDSGIRSGADIFIALAAGADAVIIGRSAIYGLAAGGESGVRRVIDLMTDELRTLMTLSGAAHIADITADRIQEPS